MDEREKEIHLNARIIKTGPRRGDAAEMCIIELV
ncbi:MAG TPA: hypothetical protein IAD07_03615 [Candidatus Fimivicinus intestinavium]|nr:hypothetical protein [Candidatus Fimivicinus intestinavium]